MNFQIERLKQLPQRKNETWQGGLTRMPLWLHERNTEPYRPWVAGWISIKTKLIHTTEPRPPQGKNLEMAVSALVDFACSTELAGYRPEKIEVKDPALAEHLSGFLAEADIVVEQRDKLFTFDNVIADMAEKIDNRPLIPDALDAKAVTVESMRSFADAACRFYQAKPWQYLIDEDLIEIESPFVDAALRYVTVLGAGGSTYGLGFLDSVKQFESLYEQSNPETFALDKHWLLSFEPITELPFGDADLWEDHNLPIAAPNAYPLAVCYLPKKKQRRPGPDILAFLEGLMRTLAETTEEQIDSGRWSKTVTTSRGQMEFTLSLPDLLENSSAEAKIKRGLLDRRGLERTHLDIQRMMAGRDFDSMDELNEFINSNVVGKEIPHQEDITPLEQAQDLMYQAFAARGRKQLQLTRKALEICPDCADAYVLLAERCSDIQKARDLYAKGAAAGERTLGKKFFKEEAGNFWGILETRPYMRARLGLAQCLEALGQVEEAVEHYREMLRLNPMDNQGIRHLLLSCLLEINADQQAQELLKEYKNDSALALWCYARALLTFRQKGNTAAARKHLQKALSINHYVSDYLLDYEELPDVLPSEYSLGTDEEAILCADKLIDAWEQTEGALEWLESQLQSSSEKQETGSD